MSIKRKTKKRPSTPPAVVWGWIQLRDWTKSVDRKLALIIAALQAPVGNDDVIPELEQAINRSSALAKQIDLKVADEQQEKG
jgi:hypothetical protein